MRVQPRSVLVAALVAIVLAVSGGTALADFDGDSSTPGYVVRPGDTLWAIAQAHHLTVWQLAAYNHLDLNAILLIGKHISFPSPEEPDRPAATHLTAAPSGPPTMSAAAFCSSLTVNSGPWGVLPSQLQNSPSRLALRPLFEHWAAYYGLSLPLLEAISWQESGWQQNVVSSAGAVGVGQVMPGTANFIQNVLIGQRLNIASASDNIRMSAAFLAYLAHIEGNNRCYTIGAYYEGPVNLAAIGAFPDTQTYVADVEALIPSFS